MEKTAEYMLNVSRARKMKKFWKSVFPMLSLVVIVSVFWWLKLVGITMSEEAFCGYLEHQHQAECYQTQLICESFEFDEEGEKCTLTEHLHHEGCKEKVITCGETHEHSEACFKENVICKQKEHTHQASCFKSELICSEKEHIHVDGCRNKSLICNETHGHGDACYQHQLDCSIVEHQHNSACKSRQLQCDEEHEHQDACYQEVISCDKQEHWHEENCYSDVLVCNETHGHEDICYKVVYVCGYENHEHTKETCYKETLTCVESEHEHGDLCKQTVRICGVKHDHSDNCYEDELVCEMSAHQHTQECHVKHEHMAGCYKQTISCGMEEHTHEIDCYSDIKADIEKAQDWEKAFRSIPKGLSSGEMIKEVAKTQLDYVESVKNFQLNDQKEKKGYTRYGEWYGNPYGDWNTMFVSFVLHYAGIEDVSYHAGAQAMMQAWQEENRYASQGSYRAMEGDIVFLDLDENETVEYSGIIVESTKDEYKIIIGDYKDKVSEISLSSDDHVIVGFGKTAPKLSKVTSAAPKAGQNFLGKNITFNTSYIGSGNVFIFYVEVNGSYYAFDGNGNAVQVYVDSKGNVTTNHAQPDLLKWTISKASNSGQYYIQNASTKRYMYASYGNPHTVTNSNRNVSSIVTNGSNVNVRSNNEYAKINSNRTAFEITSNMYEAASFKVATIETNVVWLDGTCGGLMAYGGSLNQSYQVANGETITLPSEWQTPEKYNYRLRGWYDIVRSKYYAPGSEFVVQENTVLYADWEVESFDIGFYNEQTVDNKSTNNFITTRMFDYNVLFNVMSERVTADINATQHSEVWSLVANGTVPYRNMQSLNFIFGDHDQYDIDISYPAGNTQQNYYGTVFPGLYSPELADLLFSTDNLFDPTTGEGVIGKTYAGEGDYFFQYNENPNDEFYGYYYYDSFLNAASYNQSDQRFYIYNYLECTTDSSRSDGDGKYSDFLPLNSPYANLNEHDVRYYTYNGKKGEYAGVNHVLYDARYNTGGSTPGNAISNFQYGMSIDIEMYLPYDVGERAPDGSLGNKDLNGNSMHFRFTGDDDVWVLCDGELILDLGGVHNIEKGDINFATGEVRINDQLVSNISGIKSGDHVLTIYYLERGSSQSNCAIYFNLRPRLGFKLQKEDFITRERLNGAEFSFYLDEACTKPAPLYDSEEAYKQGASAKNTFVLKDGEVNLWGLSGGRIYYIKETKPPTDANYTLAHGLIILRLDNEGNADYRVQVKEEVDAQGNKIPVSEGFDAYGFKLDQQGHYGYLTVSNYQAWEGEDTSVTVFKEWQDQKDHSKDSITVYLTLEDEKGKPQRIREAVLNASNNWSHTWTKLPKYQKDGTTPNVYGIEEAYHPGYTYKVTDAKERVTTYTQWNQVYNIEANKQYQLRTAQGVLSTVSSTNSSLQWVNTVVAQELDRARWSTTINSPYITFVNGAGQILTLEDTNSPYFHAPTYGATYQGHIQTNAGSGFKIYTQYGATRMYFSGISNGQGWASSNYKDGLIFQFYEAKTMTRTEKIEGIGFKIENIPLEEETSLKVIKSWYIGMGKPDSYLHEQVSLKLFADGKDTNRTVIVNAKNNWTAEFNGLPYKNEDGTVIKYSIVEDWEHPDWTPNYGDVMVIPGESDTYEVIVTNVYNWGNGYELPSTHTNTGLTMVLGGLAIALITVVSVYFWRKFNANGGESS